MMKKSCQTATATMVGAHAPVELHIGPQHSLQRPRLVGHRLDSLAMVRVLGLDVLIQLLDAAARLV